MECLNPLPLRGGCASCETNHPSFRHAPRHIPASIGAARHWLKYIQISEQEIGGNVTGTKDSPVIAIRPTLEDTAKPAEAAAIPTQTSRAGECKANIRRPE